MTNVLVDERHRLTIDVNMYSIACIGQDYLRKKGFINYEKVEKIKRKMVKTRDTITLVTC